MKLSVNADDLLRIRDPSEYVRVRIEYNEVAQVLSQYLNPMRNQLRVYPHHSPLQVSGRWSTTNPPLTNFPPDIRDTIKPDADWPWVCWDLDAIEAKIVAAYSHDKEDLEAFAKDYDIHTIAACKMTGIELPPNLLNPHTSSECEDWRGRLGWKGKDDRRRLLAKVRYCLLYGKDHTAVRGSKYERDMVKMGFTHADMERAARLFIASKPNLQVTKKRYWTMCAERGYSITLLGRTRKLFGSWWNKAKEGWNHMIQGFVTDMTNLAIIDLCSPPSPYILIHNAHDGCKVAIPCEPRETVLAAFHKAVEKDWLIDGETIRSKATWKIIG